MDDPFLNPALLPYGAPALDLMKPEIFLPALEQARVSWEQELDNLVDNPAEPTFKNTIEAYEFSGEAILRLTKIYKALSSTNNNDDIRSISRQFNGRISFDDQKFFARVKKIYDARNILNLNAPERALLERTYREYVRDGVLLSQEARTELNGIPSQLRDLGNLYVSNANNSKAAYQKIIDDEADLAGVPDRARALYRQQAEEAGLSGKWLIRLLPLPTDVMQYCDNRALREEIFRASKNIACEGAFDNREIALQIVRLRHRQAQILGYDNYASYILEDRMMGNTENVMNFLQKKKDINSAAAEEYLEKVRDFADKTDGITDLKSWDVAYYGRKLKEQTFDVDLEELRPYFEFEKVLEGLHQHVEKLFNLKLTEVKDKYPVYHPDVRVYEVRNKKNGEMIGLFYGDYFARPGLKTSGAWTSVLRNGDVEDHKKELMCVHNLCNFSSPTAEQPALLSLDDVKTAFHELGHALHNLLSQNNYSSLNGDYVKWDFVEMPSQLQENWVTEKEVLNTFAVHYKTGQPLSDELMQKITDMNSFNAGYTDLRQTFLGILDMKWHMTDPTDIKSVEDLENGIKQEIPSLLSETGFKSTDFAHIFANGYAAGYHGYDWSKTLAKDIFRGFKEKGLYDPETSKALRDIIYTKGATEDPVDLFTQMTGHKPDPAALFRSEAQQITRRKAKQRAAAPPVPKRFPAPAK